MKSCRSSSARLRRNWRETVGYAAENRRTIVLETASRRRDVGGKQDKSGAEGVTYHILSVKSAAQLATRPHATASEDDSCRTAGKVGLGALTITIPAVVQAWRIGQTGWQCKKASLLSIPQLSKGEGVYHLSNVSQSQVESSVSGPSKGRDCHADDQGDEGPALCSRPSIGP